MIQFESTPVTSTFLDPQNDYEPRSITIEHRSDPLTGEHTRVTDYIPPMEAQELAEAVVDAVIPIFAPPLVEQITPQYPEDVAAGRLTRGRSVLFPNLNPYDEFSPVVAIGDQPLVRPGDLAVVDVADALCLMRDFFGGLPSGKRVGLVGWNYLPQSSSSIPHPHMQAIASHRVPQRLASEYETENAHRSAHGGSFWDALVAAERDGPRWLGADAGWTRVVAFAPRNPVPETLIVSDHVANLQAASDEDLTSLAGHLVELANAHHQVGYSAFNMALHPTAPVEGARLRARFIPRAFIVPKISSSDQTWIHLGSGEGLCMINPERFAGQLREQI